MKLVLIDGNAILHRAFHALPPMTGRDGQPTHAIYGFLAMLLRIVQDLRPTHLAVCFDRPEPTFRKTMYVGYQANRPKMDDALSSQIESLKNVVTAMKVPIFELAGFEADDLIGTLAFQATHRHPEGAQATEGSIHMDSSSRRGGTQNDKVVIVTGDRDILQLVNEKVSVYMPVQGLTNAKMYTPKEVEEKFGVTPIQIIDYKALAGDASDNYPGVRGIGPKTATELLQKFGTVEGIYNAIRSKDPKIQIIKEKTIKALSDCAEDCVMAKKLATIDTNVPVTLDVERAALHNLNTLEAQEEMAEIGFKTLAIRLSSYHKGTMKKEVKKVEKKLENEQLSLM